MRIAVETDIREILTYLKNQISDCLYMYIDIAKYGLDNKNMKVWVDTDQDGLSCVVMKYHTGISVYTDREIWDVDGVADLIKSEQAGSVTARKDLCAKLYSLCADFYTVSYGAVYNFSNFRDYENDRIVEAADVADTFEIAELIMMDESIGGYYEVNDLADQLAERIQTNMGRSFVIKDNGKIIAHIASYAEYEDLATTGGLIVHPNYRTGVYGGVLEAHLVKALRNEGFRIYTFVTERMRKKLLTALGNECVGEYGKMARIK